MSVKKRVFLLDAFALIFRGYYSLIKNPMINSKGMDTSAILGFTNSLLDVIRHEKPDLLAVAFDKGSSSVRKKIFPEYKANRDETPEAIKIAIPYIHKILEAMNIPILEEEGIEADDLIGTLSKQAEKKGFQVYMVTPDKDFAQLISENIFMYRPARMGNGVEVWDVKKVKEKFGIENPLQVIDYLGMMGDSSDNIPGLPGVGDKTAKKFLKEYGSMERLFENTHELKGKTKENIEANKELGLTSKQLATILLDCPIEFQEEDYRLSLPDFEKVDNIFLELEFRRALEMVYKLFNKQLLVDGKEVVSKNELQKTATLDTEPPQLDLFTKASESEDATLPNSMVLEDNDNFYQYINTNLPRKLLLQNLMKQKSVCISIITDEGNDLESKIFGIAFCYESDKGYYLHFPKDDNNLFLKEFRIFFENEAIEKIGHNLKSSIKILEQFGIQVKGKLFDTMLAHYLINPDSRHDIDFLSKNYLRRTAIQLETLFGKGKNKDKFDSLDISKQTDYAVGNADIIFQLVPIFKKKLEEDKLIKLYSDVEIPLLKVLAKMELTGINLDTESLKKLLKVVTEDISKLESDIYTQSGEKFNLSSPKQLGIVLFEKMKLVENPKKTKTGQYATSEEVLSKLSVKHKIIRTILEWRSLIKLKSTYIDSLQNDINPKTKRIHTTYGQAVTSTGRLSSNNPNLQNIPIRTPRGRAIREAFIPKNNDYLLFAADYSQIELRIIASLSKEKNMILAFKNGQDIHSTTASKVFCVSLEEVTRDQRNDAKTINFGILYGQGALALSQQIGISRKDAKELIDTYYETYPNLKKYMSKQIDFAREKGYVETILGRRRYLRNINSQNRMLGSADERNAINTPIQGSAADIIKIAMVNIQRNFNTENYKSKMLLQVHDELVFDIHKEELETLKPIIKREMKNAFLLSVPLEVETGQGKNWLQAH